MLHFGIGDLATSLQARRQNSELKTELARLSAELSSGQKADVSQATRGQLAPLASIERSLALNGAYSEVAAKATLKLNFVESALGNIDADLDGLAASMLGAANSGVVQSDAVISGAAGLFASAASALSVEVAGEFVFSGVAADRAPLNSAQEILSELAVITAGAGTASEFQDRVSDWFNDPAGFEAFGYLGGDVPSSSVDISSTDRFSLDVTAKSEALRNTLSGLASISLIDDGAFSGSDSERLELTKLTAESLLSSNDDLVSLQAEIGEAQSRISKAQAQNEAESFFLSTSRNELLLVDVFDVATRLEEVQTQLEGFYLITAKTARLSLAEYLR